MSNEKKSSWSRREFLRFAVTGTAAAILAACEPKIVEKVVTKEVEKIVRETVEVEVTKEVEKVVKETVIVEKEISGQRSDVQELRVCASFFAGGGDMAIVRPGTRGPWSFHSLLWAPLVAGDTAGTPIPEKSLARSWDISDDGTVYTFHLRPEAKFSDGTPIIAEHVVKCFGYYAMLSHNKARGYRGNFGPGRRLMWDVVGLMDIAASGEYKEFGVLEVPGIKAPDDHTVQVTLTKPSGSFIARLTVGFAVFHPDDMLAGNEMPDAQYDLFDYWPAHAVYCGPYKMVESVPGDRYSMVPNEHYFGPKPSISKITMFQVSEDANTRLTAFANKEIDVMALGLSGDTARQAFADPYMNSCLLEMPSWITHQFWLTPNEPLDDRYARRALTMAVDRDALVKILNGGAAAELFRRVNMHRNPAIPHCVDETAAVQPLPFDPAAAKEELKKSKYWPDVVNTEIHIYSSSAANLPECEAVQLMLTENLGMKKVTVHTETIPNMMEPPYPLHMWRNTQMPWYPDVADTLNNMTRLMGDKEWEPEDPRPFVATPYEPELRDLITQALNEQDPGKKCELVGQAGQLWNDEAFSLDFAVPVTYYLIAPWVKGFEWYQNSGQAKPLNIEEVWVERH